MPLDPAHPDGRTIRLAMDRRPATGARLGSLLVNPGGPGESGVDELPALVGLLGAAVLARFDVVSFDPPGVGHSDPVTCASGPALQGFLHVDPAPPTASGFASLVAADRSFAAGCEQRSGAILPYVATSDAARDMDLVRAALGDAGLTYLGFSYGTLLGATYAGLFPGRVRAMVLDGAVDPALDPLTSVDRQSAALEAQLQAFFASCAPSTCAWKPGEGLRAAYDTLVAKVRSSPVAVPGSSQSVGPAELLYGTAAALYTPTAWPDLAPALHALQGGDGGPILRLFDAYVGRGPGGTYSNVVEAESAVSCLDQPAPSLAQIQAGAARARAGSPTFGLLDLYSEVGCTVWPVPATGSTGPIVAPGSPPIVVVGSTGDPVTPYSAAVALAGELSRGVLVTRVGPGHTGYPASSCVRGLVDNYLVSRRPPPAGVRCASD